MKYLVFFLSFVTCNSLTLSNDNAFLEIDLIDGTLNVVLGLDDNEKLFAKLGLGMNVQLPDDCDQSASCTITQDDITLSVNSTDSGFTIFWISSNLDVEFSDCINFKSNDTDWYGGPETYYGYWPVQSSERGKRPYATSKNDYNSVTERYWLNSKGAYVYISAETPLHLDENVFEKDHLCLFGLATDPYINRQEVILEYNLVVKLNVKEAHLHAVNTHIGKPRGHPHNWIVRHPIWTTWAKYKKDINDEIVQEFANEIASRGFTGQIEIDDNWETCYGSLTFSNEKFPDINNTVKLLHDLGFTVSLWTHPFVNDDCQDTSHYGQANDYFAHHIDFIKETARDWYKMRLQNLKESHGIDTFKFDAGETDFAPPKAILHDEVNLSPNSLTSSYIRTCAAFGDGIEAASGFKTQDLEIFKRMTDKASRWGLDNGLQSLITNLINFNIMGYVFVLPDMIGGNGYDVEPSGELLARWIQANVFMPTMQFSYLPWEISNPDFDGIAIIRKYVALHEEYFDLIIEAMNNSIINGIPVNPPLWWVDPTNPDALKVNDQYLLGEKIMVAPVVREGAVSRDIVIPLEFWIDGNNGSMYRGPQIIKDYPAPIDVLPYFIRDLF